MNILILEPNKTSYAVILKTLRERFGMSINVEDAKAVGNMIYKIKNKVYDIIVSEYHTGEDKNGQQILEEVRMNQWVPWNTCYVIITTSEEKKKEIEKVILAGEYYPDEYILKPFTEDTVGGKLEETIRKKQFLQKIYLLMNNSDYKNAVLLCDTLMQSSSREYLRDIVRLKLVCLLKMNDFESIKKMYRYFQSDASYTYIVQSGWFKFSYANALFALGNYTEAENISKEIKKEFPKYLENFKLLADILHAQRKDEEAIFILKEALDLSPLNIEKQQLLGKIALFTGNIDVSKQAFEFIVRNAAGSPRYGIEDHAHLAHIYANLGDFDGALDIIGAGYEVFKDTQTAKFATAVMESQILSKKGDIQGANSAFSVAMNEFQNNPDLAISSNMQLYFGAECIENGYKEIGKDMIEKGMQSFVRKDVIKNHMQSVLRGEEHIGVIEKIIDNGGVQEQSIFTLASNKISTGDWKGAISLLTQETYDNPENPGSYFDLAKVKLRYIDKNLSTLEGDEHEFDKQLFEIKSLFERGQIKITSAQKQNEKIQADIRIIGIMIQELKKKFEKQKNFIQEHHTLLKTGDDGLDDILPDIML